MNTNNHTLYSLLSIFSFFVVSSFFHFLFPDIAVSILSDTVNIQVIGVLLAVLGLWAIIGKSYWGKFVGLLFLLSGLGRFFVPETMIALNELNNRYTHAVLLGIGALLVAMVLFFERWKSKSRSCSA